MTTVDDIEGAQRAIEGWLTEVVVGLNLCPFARPVLTDDTLRLVVSQARNKETLLEEVRDELRLLVNTPEISTSLIGSPWTLEEFLDFNDFCGAVEDTIRQMKLEGVVQLATFHPHYRFHGEESESLSNYTNRSPVPLLHLLREADITDAVNTHPDTLSIPTRNIATLAGLNTDRLEALRTACRPFEPSSDQ